MVDYTNYETKTLTKIIIYLQNKRNKTLTKGGEQ